MIRQLASGNSSWCSFLGPKHCGLLLSKILSKNIRHDSLFMFNSLFATQATMGSYSNSAQLVDVKSSLAETRQMHGPKTVQRKLTNADATNGTKALSLYSRYCWIPSSISQERSIAPSHKLDVIKQIDCEGTRCVKRKLQRKGGGWDCNFLEHKKAQPTCPPLDL